MKKIRFVVLALIAAVFTFAFTACSSDDENSENNEQIATFSIGNDGYMMTNFHHTSNSTVNSTEFNSMFGTYYNSLIKEYMTALGFSSSSLTYTGNYSDKANELKTKFNNYTPTTAKLDVDGGSYSFTIVLKGTVTGGQSEIIASKTFSSKDD